MRCEQYTWKKKDDGALRLWWFRFFGHPAAARFDDDDGVFSLPEI